MIHYNSVNCLYWTSIHKSVFISRQRIDWNGKGKLLMISSCYEKIYMSLIVYDFNIMYISLILLNSKIINNFVRLEWNQRSIYFFDTFMISFRGLAGFLWEMQSLCRWCFSFTFWITEISTKKLKILQKSHQ